jgi:hypothetical protein
MTESPRAVQAWTDYLALGPERSLEKLLALYQSCAKPVPTRHLTTLKLWSGHHGWQARLQAIAAQAAAEAAVQEAAYRRSILEDGYGLAHERVAALKGLAVTLHQELTEGGRLWVTDVKQVGGGERAQFVDVERFNAPEVEQFRALLDDIAKEKGERAKKIDIEFRIREAAERLGLDPDAAVAEAARITQEVQRTRRAHSG